MEVLKYLQKEYKLNLDVPARIDIPDVGRLDLAQLFSDVGFKIGAEIGVEKGLYSEALCRLNPGLLLYCVDGWKAHSDYRDHITQKKFDDFYETAKHILEPYNVVFVRKLSMDAVKDFEDGSLDFVYIDANHKYKNVYEDITEWRKKVRKGGVVSGHDYIRRKFPKTHRVIDAVDDYVVDNNIKYLFLFGSKDKVPGQVRDASRSWMFVND